jgi:hypothetical protein
MFIVATKSGKFYREGFEIASDDKEHPRRLVWDDIPLDEKITQIQLTYPFKVNYRANEESEGKWVAPLITIGKYDRYFFYNESTIKMYAFDGKPMGNGIPQLEAKIIGGIDDKYKLVIEVRLDKTGNTSINRYPLKHLEERIKAGTFSADIIRKGIKT